MASVIRCRLSCKCDPFHCRWWTVVQIAAVKRYARAGLSMAEAAARLGTTRSRVIAVAYRNKIRFHGKPGAPLGNQNFRGSNAPAN